MDPKFALWSNFDHPFPPEDDRNRKNVINGGEKLHLLSYPNMPKSRQKNTITFCNIWAVFSSLAAFLVITPTFLKKQLARLPDAKFNAESISTNLKFQK